MLTRILQSCGFLKTFVPNPHYIEDFLSIFQRCFALGAPSEILPCWTEEDGKTLLVFTPKARSDDCLYLRLEWRKLRHIG
jgi:hypothetical protein